jgi:3'-phosphoadenosine 5'-phosphosulfate sulfotransferase (PAPS reductase)/FAD synthetase
VTSALPGDPRLTALSSRGPVLYPGARQARQLSLFGDDDLGRPGPAPGVGSYDLVLVNISGGKDSQAALDVAVAAADAAGARPRVVAAFADLGPDDEWPGTAELAREHAAHYGIRFELVRREVTGPDGTRRPQGLIEHIAARGMWPDAARRYCTSDAKRAPVYRLMTRLAAEQRDLGVTDRPVRMLNVLGLRAQESRRRALLAPFSHDLRASNGLRHVDQWLPIHGWDIAQVWEQIAAAGTRPHPVYAQGMPRLSCRFCVLASRSALVLAARLDPEGARLRADLESAMGHQFRADVSMRQIISEATRATSMAPAQDWAA